MRHLPSSSALRAFEAAGRHSSFLTAASELNVTPGAVSRRIHSLEEFLGKKLFERRHRSVHLTSIGRSYLSEIQAPLKKISKSSQRIRELDQASTISICSYPTFAIRWLIPRWGSLADTYPNIDLRLTTTLNVADFDTADYDFAIQIHPENASRPGLCIEKLLDVDTFPVCSPALTTSLNHPDDLTRQTLLHNEPRPSDWKLWLETARADSVDCEAGLWFESSNLAIHAAIEGLGVAIGVEVLIQDELESGRLVAPFTIKRRSHHPIQLVYPASKATNPLFQSVREWLMAEARAARRG